MMSTISTFKESQRASLGFRQRLGKEEPLLVFIRELSKAYEVGLHGVAEETIQLFDALSSDERVGDARALQGPGTTWTYTVSDDPFPPFNLTMIGRSDIAASLAATLQIALFGPFILLAAGVSRLFRFNSRRRAP